jgi:hypothetical protein
MFFSRKFREALTVEGDAHRYKNCIIHVVKIGSGKERSPRTGNSCACRCVGRQWKKAAKQATDAGSAEGVS